MLLGGSAAEAVDPAAHLDDLDAHRGVTVVASDPRRARAAQRWRMVGAADVVPAPSVNAYVEHVRRTRPLRRLSLRDWLGEARERITPRGLAALRALPRLRRFVASEWRAAVGLSRRELDRLVQREFRHAPGAVLRDYRLRSALALREAGHCLDEVALSLGYSDKTALSRALRVFARRPSVVPRCTELSTLPG